MDCDVLYCFEFMNRYLGIKHRISVSRIKCANGFSGYPMVGTPVCYHLTLPLPTSMTIRVDK